VLPRNNIRLDGPLALRHRARLLGEGEELLVLSHGLGTGQTAWSRLAGRLPKRYRLLVWDLPGAGPLVPDDFDLGRYASIASWSDDLLALLDEAGVERCRYLGHSVSGMIGALAAIEDPDRFEQLLLLNASPRYLDAPGYTGGFQAADLQALYGAIAHHYEDWVAGFAPAAIAEDAPAAVREFAEGFLSMSPDVTLAVARTVFESDLRHVLPSVRVPCVLVHSRDDIAVPEAVARYLHEHLPHSRLEWIDARGHLPHMSAPEAVARALEPHL
jgi:sigma-B regulation protein RsbQ